MRFGGSALDEWTVDFMMERVSSLQPATIVELGSGTSTFFLAKWSTENKAKFIALEHIEFYAERTRELCAEWSADIRCVPLVYGMYKTDLPSEIDFALIDGPPGWVGKGYPGRQQTFNHLWPKLSPDFEVLLDDANRHHEKKCLQQWQRAFPIRVETITRGKGLAIIRRA